MRLKCCLVFTILIATIAEGYSQPCTTLGQTPSTAFPICGTTSFTQNNVPICGGTVIPTTCGNGTYLDVNPFYYRFHCFTSGTLAFTLDPINNNDDYDWVLFDITGRNPNEIYTDISLNVAENWSANTGNTGAAAVPNPLRNCAGNTPNFSRTPGILGAHEYLLMVSNWSASQQGYTLTFGGGTAVIADPVSPAIASANIDCGGQQVNILFNKKIKCNSLATDRSDFILSPANGTIAANTGFGCLSSFDMDSVNISFNAPLPPGTYTLSITNGTDGSTLLDNCGTPIPVGDNISFTVLPRPPLPGPISVTANPANDCTPIQVTVLFLQAVECASAALNGSDFLVMGPSPVTVTTVIPVCTNGQTNGFTIQFTAPITVAGTYTVTIVTGSDGNSIVGVCNREVQTGSTAQFTVAAQAPIPIGVVTIGQCSPTSLTLTFADPILCNTVAANGSDFGITGPSIVAVTGATTVNCINGVTNTITLQFASPISVPGNYQVQAVTGTDGNTLLGQCKQVPAGNSSLFTLSVQPTIAMGTVTPPPCTPSSITLTFPEPILCNSIAANGTDFIITGPAAVTITGATGTCNANGETNTITIQLSAPIIVSGNFQVQMAAGSDGNTLIGNCNRRTTAGESAMFTIPPASPVPMDNLVPIGCSPASLKLIFLSPIRCSSIASNGSDFIVTGPSAITVASAAGTCDANGLTTSIDIQLSSPIVIAGSYQVRLVIGSDGNTLLSDCNRQTPVGSFINFNASDTVSAAFQYQIQYNCETDVIVFSHDGQHNVNQWTWTVNGASAGAAQTFTQSFSAASQNQVQLVVSNGVCNDTHSTSIVLNNKVTVDFDVPESVCPEDTVVFKDLSTGQIDSWQWTFGNGNTSTAQSPPAQIYPLTGTETLYTVSLTAGSNNGCSATATKTLKVLSACIIAVPSAFTPNNDGKNDYLYPLNALKAENLEFKIFNRWGQLVFHSRDWRKQWDGRTGGMMQAAGVYVWMLDFTHKDTRKKYSMKGTTTLIR